MYLTVFGVREVGRRMSSPLSVLCSSQLSGSVEFSYWAGLPVQLKMASLVTGTLLTVTQRSVSAWNAYVRTHQNSGPRETCLFIRPL